VTARSALATLLPGVAGLIGGYQRAWLRRDLVAGLTVWAVVVPQALAYGELAGLSPVTGLYTAAGALLLYPLFGSSRYAHVGPESAIAIVTAAAIGGLAASTPDAAALAPLLALVTAGFLLAGALLRLDVVARLLSTPVLVGYLTGSAVVIGAGQFGRLLAVSGEGGLWWEQTWSVLSAAGDADWRALLLGVATLLVVVALMRWAPRIPGALLAIVGATGAVALLGWAERIPVIGAVARGVPVPRLPDADPGDVVALLGAGASIALLVFATSVLTASALARGDREEVSGSREFLGYAAGCVGSGLLGGFPANASSSRSFLVADAGARSQVANLAAAALTLLTLLLLTPLLAWLPQAALGAVVLVGAARMIDLAGLRRLWRIRRRDLAMAVVTCAGVLFAGVLPGIAVGVLVSLVEVLRRAVMPPTAVLGELAGHSTWRDVDHHDTDTEPGLLVYRFDAPLFFANAAVLRNEIVRLVDRAQPPVRRVVLDAEGVLDVDVSGGEALDALLDDLDHRGVDLVIARARTSTQAVLRRVGITERLGGDAFYLRVADAADDFRRLTDGRT
jgi:sulfate permease, SulP family